LADPAVWPFYSNTRCDLRPTYRHLLSALKRLGTTTTVLRREQHPLDIWIRDWAPVENSYFRYEPSYAPRAYPAKKVIAARLHLDRFLGKIHRRMPVVLDGGNVVHNGHVAIVTEKVFTDNPHLSRKEIERAILSVGFARLIFIPTEPGDSVGHADGIVRFVSEDSLLVNDYSGTPGLRAYGRRLMQALTVTNLEMELIPFPWFPTDEQTNGIWSAVGVYINFLLTKHGAVIPRFNHPLDDDARNLLCKVLEKDVVPVDASTLATFGGVFNCISWGF
jgi:agmatine/peptidylarginine deiminase